MPHLQRKLERRAAVDAADVARLAQRVQQPVDVALGKPELPRELRDAARPIAARERFEHLEGLDHRFFHGLSYCTSIWNSVLLFEPSTAAALRPPQRPRRQPSMRWVRFNRTIEPLATARLGVVLAGEVVADLRAGYALSLHE